MHLEAVYERALVSGFYANQASYPEDGGLLPPDFDAGDVGTTIPDDDPNPPTVQLYVAAVPPSEDGPGSPEIQATDLQSCYLGATGDPAPPDGGHAGTFKWMHAAQMQTLALGDAGIPRRADRGRRRVRGPHVRPGRRGQGHAR